MTADPIKVPEREVPIGICPLCGASIQEIRRVGHWRGPKGGGSWYSGSCVACDVDFRLDVGTNPVPWRIEAPDAKSLESVATAAELDSLSTKLGRYKIHSAKWKSFLARRRPGDEVWHFKSGAGETGMALVRNGRPISRFTVAVM
jgi:hypothetical protein